MIKCFFLKKKRFVFHQFFYTHEFEVGMFMLIDYLSIDLESLHKYRIYGLCVGIKNSCNMTTCHLNCVVMSNYLNFVLFLYSPFLFNIDVLGFLYAHKSKIYNVFPKMRVVKQFVSV
jgi:hypothetical protein